MQAIPAAKIEKTAAQKIVIFCAVWLPWLAIGCLTLYFLATGNIGFLAMSICSGVLARAGNEIIHIFYKRPRPAEESLIAKPKNWSFPSGHASFFLGVSFFLLPFYPWIGCIGILAAIIIFAARVKAGAHWKSDILGSVAVAAASAIIIDYLLLHLL